MACATLAFVQFSPPVSASRLDSRSGPSLLRSESFLPPSTLSISSQRRVSEQGRRRCLNARADVSVELGGASVGHTKAKAGDKVRVTGSVKVYHVPKVPEFQLEGKEGVVKEVLGVWKGVEVSANLPYKVQFELDVDGSKAKFFAHLKEDEFEVL